MKYDIIIIGSGPGGYVAAIRTSQLGMKVAVVERAEFGGICLNWGCIPTKSLLKSAQVFDYIKNAGHYGIRTCGEITADFSAIIGRSRTVAETMSKGIQFLFKKNKIDTMQGIGKLKDRQTVVVTGKDGAVSELSADHIILATGARSKELSALKQDGKKIIGYREALTLPAQPRSMIVVGAGAIGAELAFFYNSIGTQVTLVEFLPQVVPLEDEEISSHLGRALKKAGMKVMIESTVLSVDTTGEKCKAVIRTKDGKEEVHEAEVVLSAVGVTPNLEHLGIEELGIIKEKDKIKVDDFYRTNVEGVYAIGDIVHGPALAHVASAEGIICVEKITGKHPEPLNYKNIPSCIYTTPEVASVGLSEKEARQAGYEIKIGKFPFTASGKATAAGARDGFVKLIFHAQTFELLGAHLIGDNVTEMISGLVVARKLETTAEEILRSVHPHPTMSEAIMEAAAAALGEVIHI